MPTPEQIDSLEISLTNWIGATNASTLLQLLGARPRSTDIEKNPLATIRLIEDLHDALAGEIEHELADAFLRMAGYPASWWVPSCANAS